MIGRTVFLRILSILCVIALAGVIAGRSGARSGKLQSADKTDRMPEKLNESSGVTTRVSIDSYGAQGDNQSYRSSLSTTGRWVAFESSAGNLVPNDTNGVNDIFVHDQETYETTRVSISTFGVQGNSSSGHPSISGDGRFVAFESHANNLVPEDSNGRQDVFVHDRHSGITTRVSVDSSGAQGNWGSSTPSISGDGRFVAFESDDLVPGDTNSAGDIFVHDRTSGQTTRVSVTSAGGEAEADHGFFDPVISADGHHVTFWSYANYLVPGDSDGSADVFVHDMTTGNTDLVSFKPNGEQNGFFYAWFPSISGDGRYVAFRAHDSQLPDWGEEGIYLRDRLNGTTSLITESYGYVEEYWSPSISDDGMLIVIDGCGLRVYDRNSGETKTYLTESVGPSRCETVAISGDGQTLGFHSSADDLVPGDINGATDVFVHATGTVLGATICPKEVWEKQPLLLIHGWGDAETMEEDEHGFEQLKVYLQSNGWVEHCNLFFATGVSAGSGFANREANIKALNNNIKHAFWRMKLNNPAWNGHMDIIGHSYGGLNARFYLESYYHYSNRIDLGLAVDNLYTLGSPHGGVRTRDELYPAAKFIFGMHLFSPSEWISGLNLDQSRMSSYNDRNQGSQETCYRLIGGDFLQQPGLQEKVRAIYSLYKNETANDIGVSIRSSLVLSQDLNLWSKYPNVVAIETDDMHGFWDKLGWYDLSDISSYVRPSTTFAAYIEPIAAFPVQSTALNLARCTADRLAQRPMIRTNEEPQNTAQPVYLGGGSIPNNDNADIDAVVDWTGETSFYVIATNGILDMSLTYPLGSITTQQSTESDPNVEFGAFGSDDGGILVFSFTEVVPGNWTVHLDNAPETAVNYDAYLVPNTTLELSVAASEDKPVSMPQLISATLQDNGVPVSSASVTLDLFKPDGSSASVTMIDDGSLPDEAAGDGIYTAIYLGTDLVGSYAMLVRAQGTHNSQEFKRTVQGSFQVSPDSVVIDQVVGDSPIEMGDDGLHEYLEVDVSITATETLTVTLSAILQDNSGQLVDLANTTFATENGAQIVDLRFSGEKIRQTGIDGPFTVTDVQLIASEHQVLASELIGEYQTDPYDHTLFGLQYPPDMPWAPVPLHKAELVSKNCVLSWAGSDPNPYDTLTYDLYLDTTSPPEQQVAADIGETLYDPPSGLYPGTTYYWRLIAKDDRGGVTMGPVWSFTTITDPDPYQDIELEAGWNMISSFVEPASPAISDILSEIEEDFVLMKNGDGQVYWPALDIDNIVNWDTVDGYQIYMNSQNWLFIYGAAVDPAQATIDLLPGWSLVAYTLHIPLPVDQALDSVNGPLTLAKNGAGQVYWPAFSVNQISNMQPGEGYQLLLNSGGTLIYSIN